MHVSFFIGECSGGIQITYRHVLGVGLRAKLANQGSAGGLHPLEDGLLLKLAVVDSLLLIEILVENNRWLLDTFGLGESGVVGGTEKVGISLGLGERGEALVRGLVIGGHVADDNDLIHGLEVLQVLLGHAGNGGHRLLGHVGDNPRMENTPVSR